MNFTLKQLRYVEATGRLGSIARAASELSISQSSITSAITALETQIGFDLFVRTPAKGISITPAGQETLRLISGFLVQSRQFEAEIGSLGGGAKGSVRVSCFATAAPSFLPPILQAFKARYPNTPIKLLEGDIDATAAHLAQGEADLAFTYALEEESGFEFTPLFAAPPFALIPADNPLCTQSSVSLTALASLPMVMLDLPRSRDYFSTMFEQLKLQPMLAHSTRSAEIVRALVASGHGFSLLNILPPDYQADDPRYRVLPISDRVAVPIFGISTVSGVRQLPVVKEFISQCLELKQAGVFEKIVVKGTAESTKK